jgi:hypothetical protein
MNRGIDSILSEKNKISEFYRFFYDFMEDLF